MLLPFAVLQKPEPVTLGAGMGLAEAYDFGRENQSDEERLTGYRTPRNTGV